MTYREYKILIQFFEIKIKYKFRLIARRYNQTIMILFISLLTVQKQIDCTVYHVIGKSHCLPKTFVPSDIFRR